MVATTNDGLSVFDAGRSIASNSQSRRTEDYRGMTTDS